MTPHHWGGGKKSLVVYNMLFFKHYLESLGVIVGGVNNPYIKRTDGLGKKPFSEILFRREMFLQTQ